MKGKQVITKSNVRNQKKGETNKPARRWAREVEAPDKRCGQPGVRMPFFIVGQLFYRL